MHFQRLLNSILGFVFVFFGLGLATLADSVAASGLKVAIFNDIGADSDKILSLFRAVQAMGHTPLGITHSDVLNNRLTRANFDVFILPAGEGGQRCGDECHSCVSQQWRRNGRDRGRRILCVAQRRHAGRVSR